MSCIQHIDSILGRAYYYEDTQRRIAKYELLGLHKKYHYYPLHAMYHILNTEVLTVTTAICTLPSRKVQAKLNNVQQYRERHNHYVLTQVQISLIIFNPLPED